MIINTASLISLFTGYSAAFRKGFEGVPAIHNEIALTAPSLTEREIYPWLGQFPGMRKWVGSRVIKNLEAHDFTIVNERFEDTIGVPREKIEDDKYGMFSTFFTDMGRAAAEKPDELVSLLLRDGFTLTCYDGQYFFDTDHPVRDSDGAVASVSNMQAGADTPWFLLDTGRAMRPLIWQERMPFDKLVRKDQEQDDNVFMNDEYLYGVRGRGSAGYGLWQLAFGSKAPLTSANYEAARAAMMAFRGDEGRPLGVKPTMLVVPPSLEGAAMRILNNGTRTEAVDDGMGGSNAVAITNEWAGTAKLVISHWLAA